MGVVPEEEHVSNIKNIVEALRNQNDYFEDEGHESHYKVKPMAGQ